MKKIARNLVASLLASFARAVVRKYRPTVVMVTGSVGKTSTKDAVAVALTGHSYVRASEKSYNSEFGVPLTIFGCKNPWTSAVGWTRVFLEAFALLALPSAYPRILVLEVGADYPGDITRILRIVTPDVVVVTRLPDMPVHVEAYATPEAVREEEFLPALALPYGAPLILSADDPHAQRLAEALSVDKYTYGMAADADVRIGIPELLVEEGKPEGMQTTVYIEGEEHKLVVRGAIGNPQLLAPAAAIATALALDATPEAALRRLESYVPPAGRGRLLKGKDGAIVLDDTYNASPAAVIEALNTLTLASKQVPGSRRVAVLGDMLELGRYSNEEHTRIGSLAAGLTDVLVTVGPRAHAIADEARIAGLAEDKVRSFETSAEAAPQIAAMAGAGDIVLVKGSQSIRTERIVEQLLADSADRQFLVRQEREWKKR
ncbi:MAG TPA: UDP-N-acetylmuramoyl-tripeptide--D-alanyl-D-alanine ligase [Candidatus Paceibacterota bacterium]|jgi:UDP-N-acetylmuramyl pentapeptide synthase